MEKAQENFNKALYALLNEKNYKEIVSEMVAKGFDINSYDEKGETLMCKYFSSVRWYYRHQDGSPLFPQEYEYVSQREEEVTKFLESLGAQTETENSKKRKQKIKMLGERIEQEKLKYQKKKYLDTLPPKKEFDSIEDALKYENLEALKKFIAEGANINAPDSRGKTILDQYINIRDTFGYESALGQATGNYITAFSQEEAEHADRVIALLKSVGATQGTDLPSINLPPKEKTNPKKKGFNSLLERMFRISKKQQR